MILTLDFKEIKTLVCGLQMELWEQRCSDAIDGTEDYEFDRYEKNKALIDKLHEEMQHGQECQLFFNADELHLLDEACGHISDVFEKFETHEWFHGLHRKIESAAVEQYEREI